jgi:hypothetical protein
MYISRGNPKEAQWIPINIHITHERLQIFFTKFVAWLDHHIEKPWSLFLPIKGSKLITDPYGFISIDDWTKADIKMLEPTHCPFVYQVPIDPATRQVSKVENEWIQYLRNEYETQLTRDCTFSPGEDVLFRETVYKNLRGIFQYHPDPQNPVYSTVAVNMFSTQFLVTVPSRYLERYSETEPNTINKLSMFFVANTSLSEEIEDEGVLD